jgi:hypothetical protein
MIDRQEKLQKLLAKQINFRNHDVRKAHFLECLEFLFELKNTIVTKEDYVHFFNKVRDEVVFDLIPAFYKDDILEKLHTNFVNDLNEIVIDFGPRPFFWKNTYESFLKNFRYHSPV